MKHTDKGNIALYLAGFAATAVMLTLAQAPIGIWPLAWVAYVPFIVVCLTPRQAWGLTKNGTDFFFYIIAYIVGAGFWLGNLYWLNYVTTAGWISFCLYTAILWPILVMGLRWCRAKRIPLFIATAILVVGIEQSQGFLLGGFNWFYLGHSQYANTTLIQIADIFGATGVSFLAGMVNGAIAEIIISRRRWLIVRNSFIVSALIISVIIYGNWRIKQTEKFVTTGPVVGAVQTNVPQSVKESFAAEEEIFEGILKESKECSSGGAKLIVWPETMVQGILEPRILGLLDEEHLYKTFDNQIREHAKQGTYILAGAYGGSPRIEENGKIEMAERYNAAFLYRPDGNQAAERYYKIHLVPFGEYIPFTNIPLIHNLLLKMSPYDFDYTLNPGSKYTVFEMKQGEKEYRFSVIICYEDAVPYEVRKFVLDKEGRKRIDWLVNISNDGWFVKFVDKKVITSTELAQHTAICAFRAVENRLAVVRGVNTGISCMIDSLGRIRDGYSAGNLPKEAFGRQGVEGWFADSVPIDSRITIFSRYGQWLDLTCQLCLGGIIILMLVERFIFKKQKS